MSKGEGDLYGNDTLAKEAAYALQQMPSAGCIAPRQITRREILQRHKEQMELALEKVNSAIAALDAHPELESFMDTLQAAGI